jgi:Outer membrane protein beta-barrel domain
VITPVPIAAAALLALASAPTASAQGTPRERVAVTVGASYQVSATTFSDTATFEAFAETGSIKTDYSVGQHPGFDAGVVVRLWRGLGVGVAGSSQSGTSAAQITGSIPHPITANQPRTLTGTADVTDSQSAIHLQAVYWFQPSRRLDVMISGGPSRLRVEQDFVSDVNYTQTFPYDSVTFQSATLTRESKTAHGANAGVTVGVRVLRHISVAGLVRYSSARVSFPDTGLSTFTIGGLQTGGGVQLTF